MKKEIIICGYFCIGDIVFFSSFINAYTKEQGLLPEEVILVFSSDVDTYKEMFLSEKYMTLQFDHRKYIQFVTDKQYSEADQICTNFLNKLPKQTYNKVTYFEPIYERVSILMNTILPHISAKERILSYFEKEQSADFHKEVVDLNFFDRVLPIKIWDREENKNIHILYKMRQLLHDTTACDNIDLPKLSLPVTHEFIDYPPYIAIKLGSSDIKKTMSIYTIIEVVLYLIKNKYHIVLLGHGKDEQDQAEYLQNVLLFEGIDIAYFHNMINKTTLPIAVAIARDAAFSVCNDTSLPNLLHCVQAKYLVIAHRLFLHAFFPYPKEYNYADALTLYAETTCARCSEYFTYACRYTHSYGYPCMHIVDSESILSAISSYLQKKDETKIDINPQISVITSSYNAENTIRASIESVLNQTFTNFEYIIVDDASSDSTPAILKEYASKDSRIKLFFNDVNQERCFSRNRGIQESKAPYIAMLDNDDIFLPEKLEKQYTFMQNNPHIAVCGTWAEYIGEGIERTAQENDDIRFIGLFYSPVINSSIFLRKEMLHTALDSLKWYDENYLMADDYALLSRIIINPTIKLYTLPEVLIKQNRANYNFNDEKCLQYWRKCMLMCWKVQQEILFQALNIPEEYYNYLSHKALIGIMEGNINNTQEFYDVLNWANILISANNATQLYEAQFFSNRIKELLNAFTTRTDLQSLQKIELIS